MSYQRDRDQFIARMTREGAPLWAIEAWLRLATTINRLAELACSSEAADRDRVPCPAVKGKGPCLCDSADDHDKVLPKGWLPGIPRIRLQDWRAEQRALKVAAELNKAVPRCNKPAVVMAANGYRACEEHRTAELVTAVKGLCDHPARWEVITEGDPRGCTLRIIPPSYAERNQGRDRCNLDAIGVPARESRIRW